MKLAALYSGGKDSTLAIYDSLEKGHSVDYLVTMDSKNPESYMFHYPNIKFTSYQAESMGINQIIGKTKGEKEKELEDLKATIKKAAGIKGLIAGGLASKYQYNRIKSIAESMGLKIIIPYWGIDPETYWKILLGLNFKIMITGVACEGLGKEWLGRVIDAEAFKELKKLSEKHRFHLAFEGGEAESFVLDCPLFSKKIEVKEGEAVWNRDSGFFMIKRAELAEKVF